MVDLGKMLGPTGANMRAVKVEYDEATAKNRGEIIPVVVTVFEDRSHTLVYKTPPTSFLIRKALGIQSGAANPLTQTVGTLSAEQVKRDRRAQAARPQRERRRRRDQDRRRHRPLDGRQGRR